MSKVTDIILSNPANRQAAQILSGIQQAYDNADYIGAERSAITGLHQLMLSGVDSLAQRAKSASTDLMETLLGISILEFCDFNTKMGIFMNRLMQININEKRITLNNLGRDAVDFGISDNITGNILKPTYAEEINYVNFVNDVHKGEPYGVLSTQKDPRIGIAQKTESPDKFDYGNLYPDDLATGEGPDFPERKKWRWESNQNSILFKTKRLFEDKKINTIISRFGTQADGKSNHIYYNGSKRTVYGESHGRNLLKAAAERSGAQDQYVLNGYNNPYCRVWTHHYQYNQFYKTIRPFSQVEYANGTEIPSEEDTLTNFHTWKGFEYGREEGDKDKGYGWKNDGKDNGWDKSVLNLRKGGDGIVKITPKYVNSRATNIHTKECMFSIENLAWKGYDPYSFEKALSWEQRGPLGGRIMWFPPYGITFNETTNVNWSSNTFIGRGEDVYTYVNTMRSGTLSFLMVVDHPSVIDYASWYDDDSSDPYEDTDLMRFFAGCDSLDTEDPRSIMSRVKPTPLTDEYLAEYADDPGPVEENPAPQKKPDPVVPKETRTVSFYAFYPNNYSGYYDDADFAIAYLLAGVGCQKRGAEDMTTMLGSDFTFPNLSSIFENQTNPGYEMIQRLNNGETTNHPVSFSYEGDTTPLEMMQRLDNDQNFIYGTAKAYANIPKTDKKRWYYRVDGEYKVVSQSETRNTYRQKIPDLNGKLTITPENTNYCDTASFKLNSSMENWPESFTSDEGDEKTYCTLADFAQAIAKIKNLPKVEEFLKGRCVYGDIIATQIWQTFLGYKLVSVDCVGYSNSHGWNASNKVNANRNSNLAVERGNTIIKWLKKNGIIDDNVKTNSTSQPSTPVGDTDKYNHSGINAKLWRSAKITLTFETDVEKKLAELKQAQEEEENNVKFEKYTGYTPIERDGKTVYKGEDGKIWVEVDKEGGGHELVREDAGQLIGVSNNMRGSTQYFGASMNGYNAATMGGSLLALNSEELKYGARRNPQVDGDKNVYRYDQEYYFFRALKKKDPLVFNKLMDKIKYFDPAFHSMTPEGFNARLTFLHQCTRQGNTITMSDYNGKTANNLAFGRPPFCVLRIGDFYNQMIVIDNISIDYNVSNGISWDMNTEGIGMQPLLAQINISFKFIGGGDIAGPIRRLQNAMSFNYYANTRFYDNRADRVVYKSDDNWKEIGGAGNHEVDLESEQNYAYVTDTYTKIKKK